MIIKTIMIKIMMMIRQWMRKLLYTKDVSINRIEDESICCDTNLVINSRF